MYVFNNLRTDCEVLKKYPELLAKMMIGIPKEQLDEMYSLVESGLKMKVMTTEALFVFFDSMVQDSEDFCLFSRRKQILNWLENTYKEIANSIPDNITLKNILLKFQDVNQKLSVLEHADLTELNNNDSRVGDTKFNIRTLTNYSKVLGFAENELKGEILDIGSGKGNFKKNVGEAGLSANVVTMDPYITDTEKNHIGYRVGDETSFRLLPNQFDLVISCYAVPLYSHNWEDVCKSIIEMSEILKRGGKLKIAPLRVSLIKETDIEKNKLTRGYDMHTEFYKTKVFEEFLASVPNMNFKLTLGYIEGNSKRIIPVLTGYKR